MGATEGRDRIWEQPPRKGWGALGRGPSPRLPSWGVLLSVSCSGELTGVPVGAKNVQCFSNDARETYGERQNKKLR